MITQISPSCQCCGCLACKAICPKQAIEVKYDELGFCHPFVTNYCIECGLCQKSCPINETVNNYTPKYVFAAFNKNKNSSSTSGGIAFSIYKTFINNNLNAICYGVIWDKNQKRFVFKFATQEEEIIIKNFAGSKYIQADIGDSYINIRNNLIQQKQVVFIGTPCQVAGLKTFLKKKYLNLLTVDIVCHGTPSQKMFFDSLNLINDFPEKIWFRKGTKYEIGVIFKDGKSNIIPSIDSLFYEGFHSGKIVRESCHTCPYTNLRRVGDITLGDFWGLDKNSSISKKAFIAQSPISLVMLNSQKGIAFFDSLKSHIEYEKRTIEEAIAVNSQLSHPIKDTFNSISFRKLYKEIPYADAIIKSRSLKQQFKHFPGIWYIVKILRGLIK